MNLSQHTSLTLYIPVNWVFRPMVRLWLIQQCSWSQNLVFLIEKLSQIIENICCTYGDSGSLPALFKCCRGSWLEGSQHSQVGCERWACYQPGQKGVCPLEVTQRYQNQLVDKVSMRFWRGVLGKKRDRFDSCYKTQVGLNTTIPTRRKL